jgi:hypothetical protein
MNADATVTAVFTLFTPNEYTLTVTNSGTGTGTVTSSPAGIGCGSNCSKTYKPGTKVTLKAKTDPNSMFMGWSGGGCSGTGTCTVTMNAETNITATFTSHILTVTNSGTGTGTVTSSPAGIGCGSNCSKTYKPGTRVTLKAKPDPNSIFTGWSGGGCSGGGTCVITMDGDKAITGNFVTKTPGLTYSSDPGAHILFVDLTNPNIRFRTVIAGDTGSIARESVKNMASRYGAIMAINGDYFGKGHGPEGMTYIDGNMINYDDKRSSLAISSNNQADIGKGQRDGFMYNVVGGGPQFISDGMAYWNRNKSADCNGGNYNDVVNGECFPNSEYWDNGVIHTAAGLTRDGKRLIIVVTKIKMKPIDLALKLVELGAYTGMKFDGGSSSSMYFNGKTLRGGKSVADGLLIIRLY